ncbi:hypothetical protein SPHINGO391_490054 [Sphingomonas aurantiaca]|uniref:Uncharacterized protein n=1 Tax=Sphingomonas aurantiaca TaxID=185949 RepID=A0A5E8A3C3_9SPHN|nr:hypothetical protein SPHINGO391_490054 [Sphingomonas aurantiaca]
MGPGLRRGGALVNVLRRRRTALKAQNGPIRPTPLFSREGRSPVWIPAFAGKHTLAHQR